jgi:hypothetical protein
VSQAIDSSNFSPEQFQRFRELLRTQAAALRALIAQPGFGEGERTLGAELELCIIDRDGNALPVNRALLAANLDPHLTVEIDKFNLEYNLSPVPARGAPFAALQMELHNALASINRTALSFDGRVVPVGILPTLTERDLSPTSLTDLPRYRALNEGLQKLRHAPFEVRIDGEDPLTLNAKDITLEGANTSFQVHLRVTPAEFADWYNAAQLATPIALALASNSPIFLGHQLWDETRVALFKQSLDYRDLEAQRFRPPARVGFGHGWVQQSSSTRRWHCFRRSCRFSPRRMTEMLRCHACANCGCTRGRSGGGIVRCMITRTAGTCVLRCARCRPGPHRSTWRRTPRFSLG